jgi:hypothetical protein
MNAVAVLPNQLDRLSVADLAALPAVRKLEIQRNLAGAAQWLKSAQEKFAEALEVAYGEQCRQLLKGSGRDFGAVQLRDGEVELTYELPKKVRWDQAQLRQIAERIVAGGEQAEHYIDAKLSVPESRWKGWPPVLQAQFSAARTVEAGKPSITLAMATEVR